MLNAVFVFYELSLYGDLAILVSLLIFDGLLGDETEACAGHPLSKNNRIPFKFAVASILCVS